MMNEKVEVKIGNRQLVVEIADLLPTEIAALANKVSERMAEFQASNPTIADSSKISLLVALSFAADLERERQASGSSHRSGIAGHVIALESPKDAGEYFRALLSQEDGSSIRLLIPTNLIDSVCRAFVARNRVSLTGRLMPNGEQPCFSVEQIARGA